jgi:hypothetical protein
MWIALAAGSATIALLPAQAQRDQADAALAQLDADTPGTLINDPTGLDWPTQGEVEVESLTDAAIPGGGAANRYTVKRAGPEPYSVQASVPLTQGIERGDTVTVGFWARTESAETDAGRGRLTLRLQLNQAPWPGFGDTTLEIGPEWKWHEVSATATSTIRRGSGILAFHLAGARQTIAIGQTIVVKGAAAIVAQGTAPVAATVEMPEPLKNAGRLINDPANRGWRQTGPESAWLARAEPAIWLGQATRYTASAGMPAGAVTAAIPIPEAIATGDKLLIAIVARTQSAESLDGRGQVGIRVQDNVPPHDAIANVAATVGTNWGLIRVPITAPRDLPAGRIEVVLDFARTGQAIDIGPVYVFKVP